MENVLVLTNVFQPILKGTAQCLQSDWKLYELDIIRSPVRYRTTMEKHITWQFRFDSRCHVTIAQLTVVSNFS